MALRRLVLRYTEQHRDPLNRVNVFEQTTYLPWAERHRRDTEHRNKNAAKHHTPGSWPGITLLLFSQAGVPLCCSIALYTVLHNPWVAMNLFEGQALLRIDHE